MKPNFRRAFVLLFLVLFSPHALRAALPTTLNYQGRVRLNAGGAAVPDSTGNTMVFSLYTVASGGSNIWTETWNGNVATKDGLFNVVLGSISPINNTFDQQYWLGVSVNGDAEMTPRQPLTLAPYAFRAKYADSANAVSLQAQAVAPFVPGDGQVLTYITANNRWEPANAAGVTAPLSLTSPSQASTISAFSNATGGAGVFGSSSLASGYGIVGKASGFSGTGIYGLSSSGTGVQGAGVTGVTAFGSTTAFYASPTAAATGLQLDSSASTEAIKVNGSGSGGGILVQQTGTGIGINVNATNNSGVQSYSNSSYGVQGQTGVNSLAGIYGTNTGAITGSGVLGEVANGRGVEGRATGTGIGVYANAVSGVGLSATATGPAGIGGSFGAVTAVVALGQSEGIEAEALASNGTAILGRANLAGNRGVHGRASVAGAEGVRAEATVAAATALHSIGNAVFDGASNTTTFNTYVSFSAGTNLGSSVPVPLNLTNIAGTSTLATFNSGGGSAIFASSTASTVPAVDIVDASQNANGAALRADSSLGAAARFSSNSGRALFAVSNNRAIEAQGNAIGLSATASGGSGIAGYFQAVTGAVIVGQAMGLNIAVGSGTGTGLYAHTSSSGDTIRADNDANGPAIDGRNNGSGTAVFGNSLNGYGVWGISNGGNFAGVYGQGSAFNNGIGVLAEALAGGNDGRAVVARSNYIGISATSTGGTGQAYYGRANSTSPTAEFVNDNVAGSPLKLNALKFPSNTGTNGQVLSTNGVNQMTWVSPTVNVPLSVTNNVNSITTIFAENTVAGAALYGKANAPGLGAVIGENNNANGAGLSGVNNLVGAGGGVGVFGQVVSDNGQAINARHSPVSGNGAGMAIYATSTSSAGYAIVAESRNIGISVTSSNLVSGNAIYAAVSSSAATMYVFQNGSGNGMELQSRGGVGIIAATSRDFATGIAAESDGFGGTGLSGYDDSGSGFGVRGTTSSGGGGTGVFGQSDYGVVGNGSITGVSGTAGNAGGVGIFADQGFGSYALDVSGNARFGGVGSTTTFVPGDTVNFTGATVVGLSGGVTPPQVWVTGTAATNFPSAVLTVTNTANGHGIIGYATKPGVFPGTLDLNTQLTSGVEGYTSSSLSAGVLGKSADLTGFGAGVFGLGFKGVLAQGLSITGAEGIEASTSGVNGMGINARGDNGLGGYFQGMTGAAGVASGGAFSRVGLYGATDNSMAVPDPGAKGVFGFTSSGAYGVYGLSPVGQGVGVAGVGQSVGVSGTSSSNFGEAFFGRVSSSAATAEFVNDNTSASPLKLNSMRFPSNDGGTSGWVLKTDGAGNLSFGPAGASTPPVTWTANVAFPGAVLTVSNTGTGFGVVGYATLPGVGAGGIPDLSTVLSAGVKGYSAVSNSAGVVGYSNITTTVGVGSMGIGMVGVAGFGRGDIPGSVGGNFASAAVNGTALMVQQGNSSFQAPVSITTGTPYGTAPLYVNQYTTGGGGMAIYGYTQASATAAIVGESAFTLGPGPSGNASAGVMGKGAIGVVGLNKFPYSFGVIGSIDATGDTTSVGVFGINSGTGAGGSFQGLTGVAANGNGAAGSIGLFAQNNLTAGIYALKVQGNSSFGPSGTTHTFASGSTVDFTGVTVLGVSANVPSPLSLTSNTNQATITGTNSNSIGFAIGLSGSASVGGGSTAGTGVYGNYNGSGGGGGPGIGVKGEVSTNLGKNVGVQGAAGAVAQANPGLSVAGMGVAGLNDQNNGIGVYARANGSGAKALVADGSDQGVSATASGASGVAGYFQAVSAVVAIGHSIGLSAVADMSGGTAVAGIANNGVAVYGRNMGPGGFIPSILGEASATNMGVIGRHLGSGAAGSLGGSLNGGIAAGVHGRGGSSGYGIWAEQSGAGASLALYSNGNATFDGASNTTTFNTYVSFTAGSNLSFAVPLNLTGNTGASTVFASNTSNGAGVYGKAISFSAAIVADGALVGLSATASGSSGVAIQGFAVTGIGVKGTSNNTGGTGVWAETKDLNGTALIATNGITGSSASPNQAALSATSAASNGLAGYFSSVTGLASVGKALGLSATATDTTLGIGGYFQAVTAVVAVSSLASGRAIRAINNDVGSNGVAIEATAVGSSGVGVWAKAPQGAGASKGLIAEGGFMGVSAAGGIGAGTGVYAAGGIALDADGPIDVRGKTGIGTSTVGSGRIYFDTAAGKFKASENGVGYTDLVVSPSNFVQKTGDSMTGALNVAGIAVGVSAASSGGGAGGYFIGQTGVVAVGTVIGLSVTSNSRAIFARGSNAASVIQAVNDNAGVGAAGLVGSGVGAGISGVLAAAASSGASGVLGDASGVGGANGVRGTAGVPGAVGVFAENTATIGVNSGGAALSISGSVKVNSMTLNDGAGGVSGTWSVSPTNGPYFVIRKTSTAATTVTKIVINNAMIQAGSVLVISFVAATVPGSYSVGVAAGSANVFIPSSTFNVGEGLNVLVIN